MTKINKSIFFLIIFSLLSLFSYALTGTCTLDEPTHFLGDSASFICSCSGSQEQNRAGFFVWKNETGGILRSVATNSGNCITNFFGDTYTFTETYNFTGSVVFSLNADGTGTPLSWGDSDDRTNSSFSYIPINIFGCVITDVKVPTKINLGQQNINYFRVSDSITNHSLVGAVCRAIAFSADGSPLLIEPYAQEYINYRTGSQGYLGLYSYFDNPKFEKNINYLFKLECGCLNDSVINCYDVTNGENVGFKTCSTTGIFTTGDDYRSQNNIQFVGIILGLIIVISGFILLGVSNTYPILKFISYSFSAIETIFMLGVIYGQSIGLNMSLLYKINFYGMLIIGVCLAMVSFLFLSFKQLPNNDENNTSKWNEKRWDKKW